MTKFLIDKLGVPKEQTFMVVDRLDTDALFGVNSGLNTITVLSGETTRKTYEDNNIKTDYLLEDINEIPKFIK